MRRLLLQIVLAAAVTGVPVAASSQDAPAAVEADFNAQVEALVVELRAAIDAALAALPADASDEEVSAVVRAAVIEVVAEALAAGVSMEVVLAALQAILASGVYAEFPIVVSTIEAMIQEIAETGAIAGVGGLGGVVLGGGAAGGEFQYQNPAN